MAPTTATRGVGRARRRRISWRRIRQLPPTLLVGSVILTIYVLVALTGWLWVPYDYGRSGVGTPLLQPSAQFWLGTDALGRDNFSRVVIGSRYELFLALASTSIAVALGGAMGLLSGFIGGWIDEVAMRLIELFNSIPFLILALLVIAAAGPELSGTVPLLIAVVVVLYTPRVMRLARSVAVDISTRDFITVARTRGESAWSIVLRELAPNATGVLLVEFGVRAGWAPLLVGSLGFLGVGVRPPTPEWGLMLAENRSTMGVVPISVLAPAVALIGLVIGINFCTDGLARVLGRQVQIRA